MDFARRTNLLATPPAQVDLHDVLGLVILDRGHNGLKDLFRGELGGRRAVCTGADRQAPVVSPSPTTLPQGRTVLTALVERLPVSAESKTAFVYVVLNLGPNMYFSPE